MGLLGAVRIEKSFFFLFLLYIRLSCSLSVCRFVFTCFPFVLFSSFLLSNRHAHCRLTSVFLFCNVSSFSFTKLLFYSLNYPFFLQGFHFFLAISSVFIQKRPPSFPFSSSKTLKKSSFLLLFPLLLPLNSPSIGVQKDCIFVFLL